MLEKSAEDSLKGLEYLQDGSQSRPGGSASFGRCSISGKVKNESGEKAPRAKPTSARDLDLNLDASWSSATRPLHRLSTLES